MRIIAGKFKGKILKEFELSTTRPTSDLVRGAIFNIIGNDVQNCVCLDLFSGTGAVGIEAISRNAKKVYFVDNNKTSINLIKGNLKLVESNNAVVLNLDYAEALANLFKQNEKLDVIFIDPPYASDFAEKAIKLINKYDLLNYDGKIYWEHDQSKLSLVQNNIIELKTKKYGSKFVTVIKKDDLENFIKILNNV